MWNRISGKKNEAIDDSTSQTAQRKDEDNFTRQRSASLKSSNSKNKISSNTDDDERGFNPTSTAYSSTTRVPYPNTAGVSVASSHAIASTNGNDESYITPVLNRNQSLADKMPKSSTSSRTGRDRDDSGDRKSKSSNKFSRNEDDGKREKKSKHGKTEESSLKNGGISRSINGMDDGTNRGPADFSQQVGSSSFQQFPGQYDGGVIGGHGEDPNGTSRPPEHEAMSSHVQDQFPGQFPSESAEPYRPPLAANEGGPGLAADYYGDAGQSVAEQPGFRQHSPSLIIGQEPHLLPASSVAAPPPEPSASGGVGAAASFFSGEFEADETPSNHVHQTSSTYTSAPSRPNMTATSSTLPALGSAAMGATAAMGAAAGYAMGNHSSTQQHDAISTAGTTSEYMTTSSQRPPSQTQGSYYSSTSRPPGSTTSRPPTTGGRPSHADNVPIYTAAAAGVAGLAGSATNHSHHSSTGHASSNQQYAMPTTPHHRHRGPFGALVDFVKDPEGVAQFEEYSEYVGICRGCFEPGSSPRDAPRRHRTFNRKRSDERIGRTSRVEKTRRDGSDDERRRRNSPSWLATGLAGYGLGKMGEGLFKQTKNFDDTYSVKSGRYSPEGGRNHRERTESDTQVRRRRRSQDQLEPSIIGHGKIYKKDTNGFGTSTSVHATRRRSTSRSRDRKSSLAGASLGAVVGASVIGSSSRRRSQSGDRVTIKSKHKSRDGSPSEHRHRSRKKKKEKSFFSFGSTSSSSSIDLTYPKSSKNFKGKSDDKKAEAALLGLNAATAALAAAERGSSHKKNDVKKLVGRKETRDDPLQRPLPQDAGWEDEDDYVSEIGSVDSGLAFGNDSDRSESRKHDRRRRSEMSGKGSLSGRRSSWDKSVPALTGAIGTGITEPEFMSPDHHKPSSRHEGPSPPLQYVDPMPVSDFDHLDERMATSEPFPSRPPLVSHPSEDTPFHQPQPRAQVASSVYATQVPYSQTYPATAGPPAYAEPSYEAQEGPDSTRDFKLRRRDTSPARFGPNDTPSELTYRCKPSAKDDSSATSGVRFALSEKDEEERREKRRQKKESRKQESLINERHEREDKPDRADDQRSRRSDSPVNPSRKSWAGPAAVGLAGVAVGAAAVLEGRRDFKEEETKEDRRERRRREKRRDEEDEARRERRRREKENDTEDTASKREPRQDDDHEETREERKTRQRRERKKREREDEAAASASSHVSFRDLPQRPDRSSEARASSERQESPSKKEAYKHEEYSSFFTPAIDANDNQQVKISGANADADISFDQSANFVIAEPKGLRNLSGTPDFSPADTNDRIDPSTLKLPWQVPRLRLLYPTPPSTRGSTPIIEPRDVGEKDIDEPFEKNSSGTSISGNAQANDPANKYEVSTAEPREVVDRFRDPPSEDDLEHLERRKPKKIPLSMDSGDAPKEPASYGDDNSFAAVLAVSAEDAGFDPSIVIDNPTYRRRGSPPGSNDRHIPGGFEVEEDESRPKKSKRKDRSYRRQSPPEERNDDAVVNDILSQVESTQPRGRDNPEANADDFDTPKTKMIKKSKKGSKRSSAYEEAPEGQDPVGRNVDDESRPSYEEPMEDAQSVTASTIPSKDGDSRKQSKKSTPEREVFAEAASAIAVGSAVEAGKDSKSSGKKKGSVWNRVLGKSSTSLSETSETKDVKEEEPAELSSQDSKKGKKSKRKSTQILPDGDDNRREDDAKDSSKPDSEVSRSTIPSAGSVAQYLAQDSDSERSQEQVLESFLGERPDPPPPPDISDGSKQPPGTFAAELSREAGSRTLPEIYPRQNSETRVSDVPHSPKTLSSPTAVPIHFRRSAHERARSSSQSPLSSVQNANDVPQPSRPRPRSTDFENSKEYRTLWLVERNQSRQDIPRDETYPSLPSSHSTSRNSSPHSPDRQQGSEMAERRTFEPLEGDHGLMIDTGSRAMQSELLDSQQATPTATSFQRTSVTREQPSPPDSRSTSPTWATDAHDKHISSTLSDATLAAVVGSTAAFTLHKAGEQDKSQDRTLPREESKNLHGSLDDIAIDTQKTEPTTLDDEEDFVPQKKKKGKKDKKSKRQATEDFAEESLPPLETTERVDDPTKPRSPIQENEGVNLTKEMPVNEVVNIMTSAAQQPGPIDDSLASKSLPVNENAIESGLERSESKKSNKEEGKKSLADVEEPLDDEPIPRQETRDGKPIPPRHMDFKDPFKEPPREHVKELDWSPTTTPLPEDDDLDLLDEPPRSEFDNSAKHLVADVPTSPGEIVKPRTEIETNTDDILDAPTKKKGKKAKRAKQSMLEEGLVNRAEPSLKSAFDDVESMKMEEALQEMTAEPATVPLEITQEAQGDFAGFSTKKKAKKGKKAKPSTQDKGLIEDSKAEESKEIAAPEEVGLMQREEVVQDNALENGLRDEVAATTGIKTPKLTLSSQDAQDPEDELKSFSNKKMNQEDKKNKSTVLFDEPKQPESEGQADRQIHSAEEPSRDVSVEPPMQEEESYKPSPTKKKSKKSKKREQVHLDREEDDLPRATTSTSQDVQDILSESRRDIGHEPTTDEPPAIDRALHEDPPVDGDSNTEWFRNHDASTSFTERNHGVRGLGAIAAVTGTATAVHNMLREHGRPLKLPDDEDLNARQDGNNQSVDKLADDKDFDLATPKKNFQNLRQEETVSSFDGPKGPEPTEPQSLLDVEPSAERVVEAEGIEGLSTKKSKKGKKDKKSKRGEAFAYDEPVATEPAETSTPVPEVDGKVLEGVEDEDFGDSATKKSKKEKSKRKSLSRSASQGPVDEMLDEAVPKEVEDFAESHGIEPKSNTLEANEAAAPLPKIIEPAMKEAEEDDFDGTSVKKSKKDKKSKKKALSRTTSEVQTPPMVDESILDKARTLPEVGELSDDRDVQNKVSAPQPEVIEPSTTGEPANHDEQVEKRQRGVLSNEAISTPKSKKDKKKTKKAKAFCWDDEPDQLPNSEEAIATTEVPGDNGVVDFLNSKLTDSADISGQVSNAEESRGTQKDRDDELGTYEGKKDKKRSKKTKDFSWGAYASKDPDKEPVAASHGFEDGDPIRPPSKDQVLKTKALREDLEPRVGDVESDQLTWERKDGATNLDNPNEAEDNPSLKPKRSKKDKKKSKKGEAFAWDDNEPVEDKAAEVVETPSLQRTESSFQVRADAIETPGLERNEPLFSGMVSASAPLITAVQGPRDVPEQLTFDDIIEPSAVIEPREQHAQDDLPQTASEGPTTREVLDTHTEKDFVPVNKEKNIDFGLEDESVSRERSIPTAQRIELEDDVLIVEGHRAHASNGPEYKPGEETTAKNGKKSRKSAQINTDEPEIIERVRNESFETRTHEQTSQPDTPLSTGSVEMLDPEEQREYNEEYRKQLEKELSPLREDDDLLDTEEQQDYNKEYREEIERQLGTSEAVDEVAIPVLLTNGREISHPSDTNEVVEQPIPTPLEATPHHTVLSDIIEEKEPRSRSGSLQEPRAEAKEELERKKSKKGNKSKKSRQPVIWEDNTATIGHADNAEPATSHEESPRPIDLEEPIEGNKAVYRDLPSPTRGSSSVSRSPKFDNGAESYFAVKPRARAEEDVGTDEGPLHQRSIPPEQTPNLPDWSSQPKEQPLVAHAIRPITMEQERPRRERSPSRERRPRVKSPSPERAQRSSSIPRDERSISPERSGAIGEIAAVAAAGAGIVGTAELSRKESRKGKKDKEDKKSKKSKGRAKSNDEEVKSEQDDSPRDVLDYPKPAKNMDRTPGQFSDFPHQSPNRSNSLHRSREKSQQQEDPKNRDSAIQMTDSPVVPTTEHVHRPQHDSGYPATEASPVINDYDKDGQEEREIIDPYTDPRVRSTGFYQEHGERPKSITSDPRHSIVGSDEQDMSSDRRGSRRRRKRRGSNVTYDSDDSNDSGYDKQRRRRRQALPVEEPREPSPVSSTTKNRSSVLFDSSPSDRHALEEAKHMSRNLPERDHVQNEQHRLDDPDSQNQEVLEMQLHDPEPFLGAQELKEPRQSIFGGPMKEEEALSGSRSPTSNDARGRRKLKTISEDTLGNLPLARKGERDVSDVGSPDSGIKAPRTSHDLSPLVTGAAAGAAVIGAEDLVRRPFESSKDEDDRSIDMERSSSRDQDRPRRPSNQSNASAPNRDSEWRRQAIGSPDSIHAIIRTPDQVRSSSGQSLRSSGTPPLRRVDRSASGDLRGASIKSDAKRRAKMAEAEPDSEPTITIPSSSTYDPLTDKGKSRGDMADVYVSKQFSSSSRVID